MFYDWRLLTAAAGDRQEDPSTGQQQLTGSQVELGGG